MIVAVTSTIGCGKTTVSKMFGKLGAEVIDVDSISKKVFGKNNIQEKLVGEFGEEILSGKKVSRKKLAKKAFSTKSNLKKLNKITHPLIIKEIEKKLDSIGLEKIVVLDVPLLFEAGLEYIPDIIVVVSCSRQHQLLRLVKKGMNKDDALKRIASQISLKEKKKKADYIVDNNNSKKETKNQVKEIWSKLKVFV